LETVPSKGSTNQSVLAPEEMTKTLPSIRDDLGALSHSSLPGRFGMEGGDWAAAVTTNQIDAKDAIHLLMLMEIFLLSGESPP
jgi:hypothetical protein